MYTVQNQLLLVLLLICSSYSIQAQVSDDCENPTEIALLDGTCVTYTADGATFDSYAPSCSSASIPNVWLSFTAQYTTVEITHSSSSNIYTSLVAGACNDLVQLACATPGNSIQFDDLIIGADYRLVVSLSSNPNDTTFTGDFELCLDNSYVIPPINDEPCNATNIAVGSPGNPSCVSGTTVNATNYFNEGCEFETIHDTYYSFTIGANQIGVKVDLNDLQGDIALVLYALDTDCTNPFNVLDVYCGAVGDDLIDYSGLTPGKTYGLSISSQNNLDGTFSALCLEAIEQNCSFSNDDCYDAESITGIVVNGSDVCLSGCNAFATPGPDIGGCAISNQPTVWYTIETGTDIERLSIEIKDAQMDAPIVQLFSGSCNNLVPVGSCASGSNGSVEITNQLVSLNTSYFLAVSNASGNGGTFNICVRALDNSNTCVTDANLYVQPGSPSMGSPDNGPYLPGEEVTFCYDLNTFNVDHQGVGNDCQWLHGIVPQFGDAWDMALFDTSNGPPIVHNTTGSWVWSNNITYKVNSTLLTITDLDGDGTIDICNSGDFDCPNTGTTQDSPMPPGWFFVGSVNGWGDGQGCGTTNGPWNFCFTLTTKTSEDCSSETPFQADASVRIYTFADGETGAYTGGSNDICGADIPYGVEGSLNCCVGQDVENPDILVCSNEQFVRNLSVNPATPVSKFKWYPKPNPFINGATSGEGLLFNGVLTNTSTDIATQEYNIVVFDLSGCPSPVQTISVDVQPGIFVDAGDSRNLCAGVNFDLGGSPTAIGGEGNYSYSWNINDPSKRYIPNPKDMQITKTTTYILHVTDENDCSSSDELTVTILDSLQFTVDLDSSVCSNAFDTIKINPINGKHPYTVEFNSANFEITDSLIAVYQATAPAGNYPVTITIEDTLSCVGIKDIQIQIAPLPKMDFDFTANDKLVQFSNNSTHSNSFLWDFGDNNSSIVKNPSHSYAADGNYTVTLSGTNYCGADTISKMVFISNLPQAKFTSSSTNACTSDTIEFSDQSSANTTSWFWTFEGGTPSTSTVQHPTVTYTTAGSYNVQLIASNAAGSDTLFKQKHIIVQGLPSGSISYTSTDNSFNFNANDMHADSIIWDFGDGNTSTQDKPTHSYVNEGTYEVKLKLINDCGVQEYSKTIQYYTPVQATFDANMQSGCAPLSVDFSVTSNNATSWSWYFPGGSPTTSLEKNQTVKYLEAGNYDVELIVQNPLYADTLSLQSYITVLSKPQVAFDYKQDLLEVNFENKTIDGESYKWTFGDGTTSTEENPSHNYPAFGTYKVVLIATNSCGSTSVEQTLVLAEQALEAKFTADIQSACDSTKVQFMDNSLGDVDNWYWTFEGGTPSSSTEQNPSVQYTNSGDYGVRLIVENSTAKDTLKQNNFIQIHTSPVADFSYDLNANSVNFMNNSGSHDGYFWDFGDEATSQEENPTHSYDAAGKYEVLFTVDNGGICSDSIRKNIEIILDNVSNYKLHDWTIYPNPTKGRFTIDFGSFVEKQVHVQMFNSLGQGILDEHIQIQQDNNRKVYLADWPAGLYYIQLQIDGNLYNKKLIVTDE